MKSGREGEEKEVFIYLKYIIIASLWSFKPENRWNNALETKVILYPSISDY